MTEVFFHWLRVAYDAGNSPVIADGWVLVPEEPTHEMLEAGDEQFGTYDVYRRMIAASPQQEVMPRPKILAAVSFDCRMSLRLCSCFEFNLIAFSVVGLFGIFISGIVIGDHGGRLGYFGGDDA
jgi:hypothetical protein